eukprot:6203908-Pleurochrysis_carterae.AAC.1
MMQTGTANKHLVKDMFIHKCVKDQLESRANAKEKCAAGCRAAAKCNRHVFLVGDRSPHSLHLGSALPCNSVDTAPVYKANASHRMGAAQSDGLKGGGVMHGQRLVKMAAAARAPCNASGNEKAGANTPTQRLLHLYSASSSALW